MLSQRQARMLKAFRQAARLLLPPRGRLLAAVSGGPDSMALLHLLSELVPAGRLAVAHVNHRTRGRASEADEAFVKAAARRLGLRFLAARLPKPKGPLSEEALREARYKALEGLAKKARATHVATGHTAEDQAETILLRIARGTGLTGLSGMPQERSLGATRLIRPLLSLSRSDVHHYLARHGIRSSTDESNRSLRYTRNRIRWSILPELRRINPRASEALLRLSAQAALASAFLEEEGSKAARRLVRRTGRSVRIELAALHRLPRALRPLVLEAAYQRLAPGGGLEAGHLAALELGKGQVSLPGRVAAVVTRGALVLKLY